MAATNATQNKMLFWQIVAGVVGIAALLWGIVTFFGGGSSAATSNSQTAGGTINGDQNSQSNINIFQNALPANADDAQVRTTAKKFASTAPGSKPYPYIVVDTADQGLIVRTSGDAAGRQIGSLRNRSVAWVDCQADTGFNPDPTTDGGSRWLKVHWPSSTEGSAFLKSQPSDPAQGWIYTGYTVPAGHSGKIPAC